MSPVPAGDGGRNYVTLDEFTDYLEGTASATVNSEDNHKERVIAAASRAVDGYCNRRFWIDTEASARTFAATRRDRLDVDDIASDSGIIIATDEAATGAYATTWTADDFELYPTNAAQASPEAEPWRQIGAIGSYTFPAACGMGRRHLVRVTAVWGWPAVPDAVVQATLIKAAALLARRNSVQGVTGFSEFGPVRISRFEDPDVVMLLDDYKIGEVLVG